MSKKIYNYAFNLDEQTKKQFDSCCKESFVTAAALMPDAHSGYVAPIGSVIIAKDYLVPSWVGFDIGCGLISVKITGKNKLVEEVRTKKDQIYNEVLKKVPMGLGEKNKKNEIHEETRNSFNRIIKELESKPHDKKIINYLKTASLNHLGTVGSGNHFIELSYNEKELWLIIHSGSRGIGHTVAENYMKKASGKENKSEYEKTFPLKVDSDIGKEYLNVLNFCLEYALLNRLEISYRVIEALEQVLKTKLKSELWVNKNHNHAILERKQYIHRKGATPAKKGERGVIPANMRDGSFLVEGLGNPKFLYSSSHGAGRALSRAQARKQISMEEFRKSMQGIKGTVSESFIDEAPSAYKNIYEVMEAQKSSVKIVKHLLPLINWKGN